MTDDDNWLNAARLPCPGCARVVCRVDRSPFHDDFLLCCDSCARRVEVSYYDKELASIVAAAGREYGPLMAAVEPRLTSCECGGRFRHDAARRCPHCHAVVVDGVEAVGVDVGPDWDEDDESTIDAGEALMSSLTRHGDDVWRA